MNSSWKSIKLIDALQKTDTINPQKTPDFSFEYVDVSSVCNKKFVIRETSTIRGEDAPSRARRFIRAGDILLATVRPTLKRIAQVPEYLDGQICSTGYFVLRPKDFLEGKFLFYFLFTEHFMGAMEKLQKGASYPAVNDRDVSSQTILIPPLPEQKQIVAILDEAFEGIDRTIANTEKNLTNARELFESYLNTAFTQKDDGWVEKKLGDIALLSRGQNPPKSKFVSRPQEGYVRFYQIRDGKTDDYEVYVPDTPQLHRVEPDDILMVAYRHIGRVFRGASGAFNVALCKIKNKDRLVLHDDYLFHIIPTDFVRGELMKQAERSLIPSMSVKHLAEIKIPVPPIAEQEIIVSKINKIQNETQRLEAIYQQKLAALNELKQTILQKAFTGELTADTANQATKTAEGAIAA